MNKRTWIKVTIMRSILVSSLLLLFAVSCSYCASIALTSAGKAKAKIIISENAVVTDKSAASELQKYLNQITGASFDIVTRPVPGYQNIWVGLSPHVRQTLKSMGIGEPQMDQVIIKTTDDGLIITGDNNRGTIYAVYTFLEDFLGCRWWTTQDETIPSKRNLTFKPIDFNYTPQVKYRQLFLHELMAGPNTFTVKMHVNGDWHPVAESFGKQEGIIGFAHTFYTILPPDKYFTQHPEWYSMIGGKRTASPELESQLCLTNEEMKHEFIMNCMELIEKNPDKHILSVSRNDGRDGSCECDKCQAINVIEGSKSGAVIRFVNDVSRAVRKIHPEISVETLAYTATEVPPKVTKPDPEVKIRLCSYSSTPNQLYPFTDPRNKAFNSLFVGWRKLTSNIFIWDYICNFSNYTGPHPTWNSLEPNFEYLAKNGVNAIFVHGDGYNTDINFGRMRAYIIAHLAWNPFKYDTTRMMIEFSSAYYGPAAKYMLQFIELTKRAAYLENANITLYQPLSCFYLDENDLNQAINIFNKAEQAVKDNPTLLERVKVQRLSLDSVLINEKQTVAKLAKIRPGFSFKPIAEYYEPLIKSTSNNFATEAREMDSSKYAQVKKLAAQTEFAVETIPDIAKSKNLLPNEYASIQDYSFTLCGLGTYAFYEDDPAASDKCVVRMTGNTNWWVVQYNLSSRDIQRFPKCDIYFNAKVVPGTKEGTVLEYGVYDSVNKRDVIIGNIKTTEADSTRYKEYHLGTITSKPGMYIWFAPTGDDKITDRVCFDRLVFMKTK